MSECRIHLRQGDQELELEGPKSFVESQFKRLQAWFGIPDTAEGPPLGIRRNITLTAFLTDKQPTTAEERLLCLIYWLERYEGMTTFSVTSLLDWAPLADLSPGDLDSLAANNVAISRLVDDNGRLSLSFAGEQAVKEGFG